MLLGNRMIQALRTDPICLTETNSVLNRLAPNERAGIWVNLSSNEPVTNIVEPVATIFPTHWTFRRSRVIFPLKLRLFQRTFTVVVLSLSGLTSLTEGWLIGKVSVSRRARLALGVPLRIISILLTLPTIVGVIMPPSHGLPVYRLIPLEIFLLSRGRVGCVKGYPLILSREGFFLFSRRVVSDKILILTLLPSLIVHGLKSVIKNLKFGSLINGRIKEFGRDGGFGFLGKIIKNVTTVSLILN